MILAAAQIDCQVGAIQQNLEKHYSVLEHAIAQEAQLIIFPELSITGYCREEGAELAMDATDSRINTLQEFSSKGSIIIVAGAPIRIGEQIYIGSFIFHPNGSIELYSKQYLHDGEELFYSASTDHNPLLKIGDERIALAICADIGHVAHPQCAKDQGASIYAASLFFSVQGMDSGYECLESYAREHQLNILMANYTGSHWGMEAGGKSAFWNNKGERLANLGRHESGLLLAEQSNNEWIMSSLDDSGKDLS